MSKQVMPLLAVSEFFLEPVKQLGFHLGMIPVDGIKLELQFGEMGGHQ